MDKLTEAIKTAGEMEGGDLTGPYARVHPLAKLIAAVVFVVLLTSVHKYSLDGVLAMGIWLYLYALLGRLTARECFRKLWGLFALLFLVGIANPIIDRQVVFRLGSFGITTGMISMLTLFLKGAFALISAYFLGTTCGMMNILSALCQIRVPGVLLNVIYLIFRYLGLMLREAQNVWTAYRLRAPWQKGVHFQVWGSLAGSMLIRSMDKAQNLYQSMELRGYRPEEVFAQKTPWNKESTIYLLCVLVSLAVFRFIPVFSLLGQLWIKG